jgi:predicted nucleotide-binding protein (sugar kinase/HSP70/actin superfamily)
MTDRKKELIENIIFIGEMVSNKEEYVQKLKQSIIEYTPEIEYISLDDIVDDVLNDLVPIYDTYFTEEELEDLYTMFNSKIYKLYHNKELTNKMKQDGYRVGEKIGMKLSEKIEKYRKMKREEI